ncbi:MAG: TRAM domain-containing protein [archaeon GB-1867-035]|nr:TRAM domain-containing protein [Candidatus Culexmicrobium profundum]
MPRRISKRRSNKKGQLKKVSIRLREGDVYIVLIEDISANGDGIARIKDKTIFIPGAKIGEIIKVRIKAIKHNKALGEIIEKRSTSTYEY